MSRGSTPVRHARPLSTAQNNAEEPRPSGHGRPTRRQVLKGISLATAAMALPRRVWADTAKPAGAAHNVLLIMFDDLPTEIGCYGRPVITPNFDRLAARGVRFDHAYCAYPLCNPSRSSMLTGQRPDVTGVFGNAARFRQRLPDVVTLPQLFKEAGSYSARVGKIYHYGVPNEIGTNGLDDAPSWQHVVNPRGRDCTDQNKIACIIPGQAAKLRIGSGDLGATLSWLAADGTDEEQTDGKVAAETVKLLEANRKKPFFLGCGFYRPHTPFVAPKKYFEMYPLDKIQLASDPPDDRATKPPIAFTTNPANYGIDQEEQRKAKQGKYAAISFVDAQLGKVLDAMDRLELWDNTVVALTADHGYLLGEHGQWQKMTLFEGAARIPLIIAAPGMKGSGKPTERLVEHADVYPTVAELCDLKPPADLQGISLRPLLEDPQRPWKSAAFTQVVHHFKGQPIMGRSVRTEQYRYTEWEGGKAGVELYDHQADPQELHNLANDASHSAEVARVKEILHAGWKAALPAKA